MDETSPTAGPSLKRSEILMSLGHTRVTGISRLAALVLAVFSTGLASSDQAQQPETVKRIVFVCEHGSVKSLIAASYFNRAAKRRGISLAAVARGTAPQPTVPRVVQQGLSADGVTVSDFTPQLFGPADLDDAVLIVSFDQDIATAVGGRVPLQHWDNLPSVLANYRQGRQAIVTRVDRLLERLKQGRAP